MIHRYQEAMRSITLSPPAQNRIRNRLSTAADSNVQKCRSVPKGLLIAAILVLVISGSVMAFDYGLAKFLSGGINDGGLYTEELVILIRSENEHIYLTTPDGDIDITDLCSETEPYIHSFTDSDGIQHYIIAGGTAELFGFAEYIQDPASGGFDGQGWVGERASDETTTPEWLVNGERALGIRP